ncbi:hypothetical protein CRM94_17135 [Burkholderia gladioli]|uniref:Uncharacterized protein n=2 Tax=Burkholderia gladioli TaxID=28095 RepID=A0A2A7SA42_BURGA|nr:hypothetical protein CRM94_17135 [Burkholderia gladioli]
MPEPTNLNSEAVAVDPWNLIGALLDAHAKLDELFDNAISHLPGGMMTDRERRIQLESNETRDRVLAIVLAREDKLRSIKLANQLRELLDHVDADPLLAHLCRPALKRVAITLGIL